MTIDQDLLIEIVRRNLMYMAPDQTLTMNGDLFALGLDSMAAINLMLDLEQAFGVVFPDEGLTPENFATPEALASLLGGLIEETVK